MKAKKVIATCVMFATMTMALGACTGSKSGDESSGQNQTAQTQEGTASTAQGGGDGAGSDQAGPERTSITIAIPQDIDSLDPHEAKAAGTREVLFNIYEGLVKPDQNGDMKPALATEWTISDDATVYTFTLRDGVQFHDGTTVTAEDIKYSLTRCMDEQTESYQKSLSAIDSIEITDPSHLVITLSQGDSEFLTQLTTAVIPASNTDTKTNPIGTGPYKFVSRVPQKNVELTKFSDYWDQDNAAHIDDVILKVESDNAAVTIGLQAGSIDMFCRLTTEMCDQLMGVQDVVIDEGTMNLVVAMYLNHQVAPFDNLKVRQAMNYACDVKQIMDIMFDGKGEQIYSSVFPAFTKYFDDSLNDSYATDLDKAKELLKEAGYEDGFTFTATIPSNYQQYIDMAQILKEQYAQIGVTMEIQKVEWNSWLSDVYGNREYEATIVGVDASTLAASALLSRFESTAHNNFINFNSAAYDAAYQSAVNAIDDHEKTASYKECARILNEEAANVYIMDMPSFVALNKKYTGYTFYPLYVQNFATLQLAQ